MSVNSSVHSASPEQVSYHVVILSAEIAMTVKCVHVNIQCCVCDRAFGVATVSPPRILFFLVEDR